MRTLVSYHRLWSIYYQRVLLYGMNRFIARIGLRSYRPCLKSIYSIDGNVTWRCGEIGIRYALMGKTGSSCMQVQILPLPMERYRLL